MITSSAFAGAGTGTSAMNFLNIGVSARSAATGGAYSAVSDGPMSAYYNPAGLAHSENMQLAGMHSEWLQDLRYEYLGFAAPVGNKGGLGLSFSYLSYGTIQGYDASNQSTGNISAYDLAATLSYGYRITQNLSLGVGLKTVGEKLHDIQAFGIAGDFGAQYDFGTVTTGLSIMNFGPPLRYDQSTSPLPTTVNAGVSVMPYGSQLTILAGTSASFTGDYSFRGGIEYMYANTLILRTGYDSESNFDTKSGFSFGGGLNLSVHSLDYAYNINSLFGGTHQISFVYRFGKERVTSFSDDKIRQKPYAAIVPATKPVNVEVEEKPVEVAPAPEENTEPEITTSVVAPPEPVTVIEQQVAPQDEAPIIVTNPVNPSKIRYLVCAGKYGDRESAAKHVKTLKLFDVSAKLIDKGDDQYRVVLKEVKGRNKAEKTKRSYENKGITCFIEEL